MKRVWGHLLQSKRTSLPQRSSGAARDRHRGRGGSKNVIPSSRPLVCAVDHRASTCFRSCKLMLRKMTPGKHSASNLIATNEHGSTTCDHVIVNSLAPSDWIGWCFFHRAGWLTYHPEMQYVHSYLWYQPPILKSLFQQCCSATNQTFPAPVFDPRTWLGVCTSFTQSPVMTSLCRTIVISPQGKAF